MILLLKIYADSNESGQNHLEVTENPRNAMVYDAPYLQNEFGDPRFFFTFLM